MKLKKLTDIPPNIRSAVYMRDSVNDWPCCVVCGKGGSREIFSNKAVYYEGLEIHHVIERSRMGKGVPKNLVTLCTNCHKKVHAGDTETINAVNAYMEYRYGEIDIKEVTIQKGDNH